MLCSEPKHMGISWSRSSSSSSSSQLLVCIACSATALALLALPRPRYTPEVASFSRSHLESEPSWPSLHSLPSLTDAQILNWTQSFPSERSSPSLPGQVSNQSPDEADHSSIHRISHLRFAVDNAKHSGRRERGGYTFWSTDFHIAPVGDMAEVFRSLCQDFGLCMKLVENSFSGACASTFGGRTSSCAHDLHVLNQANAFDLCPRCENDIFTIPNCGNAGPHTLRRAFFRAYRGASSPLRRVDAFVCNHPPAMCELYMPFNRSLLVLASVNLELGRENPQRWAEWVASLRAIAASPRNVVAANNRYDAEYIRYFAGIEAVYVPSYCGYVSRSQYTPDFTRPVLIARNHHNPSFLFEELEAAAAEEEDQHDGSSGGELSRTGAPLRFVRTEDAYPSGFEYSDLAAHPAVVIVPYTKSVMSFFELYRMNIPLFAPTVELLVRWERAHGIMNERIYWSRTPRTSRYLNTTHLSPNTRRNKKALLHWLSLCDFYHFPHITYFSSWAELFRKLRSADLAGTSSAMARANARMLDEIRTTWRQMFLRMFNGEPPGSRALPRDYDGAMRALYGAVPSRREPSCERLSQPELGVWT